MNVGKLNNKKSRLKISAEISNTDNKEYETKGGADTQDQVFLLSLDEAEKYFADDDDRICEPTEYALGKDENIMDEEEGAGCWWWLRSPGSGNDCAALVEPHGFLGDYAGFVDCDSVAVCPALWILTP